MMYWPEPSICSAPWGMTKAVRGPPAATRGPEIRRIELEMGGPPAPSIRTAPTIALTPASSGGLQPEQKMTDSRKRGRAEQTARLLREETVTGKLLCFAVHARFGHQLRLVIVGAGAIDEISFFH